MKGFLVSFCLQRDRGRQNFMSFFPSRSPCDAWWCDLFTPMCNNHHPFSLHSRESSTTEARSGCCCCRKRMEDWKRKRIYEKIKMYDEIHHRKVLVSDDDGWQGDARRNGIINNLSWAFGPPSLSLFLLPTHSANDERNEDCRNSFFLCYSLVDISLSNFYESGSALAFNCLHVILIIIARAHTAQRNRHHYRYLQIPLEIAVGWTNGYAIIYAIEL